MIDTSLIVTEIDISEAMIKLDNKILECYNECCRIKTKIFQSEIRLNRG